MIPKIIHYCWFGGAEKSEQVKQYIQGWKTILSDYEIIEWNESTFDIEKSCEYVKEAYKQKKWAFVSDYVRLHALYEYGGIYLDTDVEVLKAYTPLLENEAFIGAESEYSLCTATIGAEKHSDFILKIMKQYEHMHFVQADGTLDMTPNSQIIYKILHEEDAYVASKEVVDCSKCRVYPVDYFSPLNCYTLKLNVTDNTYSIHHYSETWKSPLKKIKRKILAYITRIIGEKNREKIKRAVKK